MATNPRTEVWFRRFLIGFSVAAGLCLVGYLGALLWAENSFTGPEAVVAAQSMMLARDGTLYYDLNRYPYTVSAYTPIFYLLEAGLNKVGLPAFPTGRAISFLALLGIVALVWRIGLLYTKDRYCAWTASLLCASTALLLFWGSVGQTDMLAVFFALFAFERYSRRAVLGEGRLWVVGALLVLAFFTKQTTIAASVAIFLLLVMKDRKTGLVFGASLAGAVAAIALGVNAATHGRFLANTVFANLNPFAAEKLGQHLRYFLLVSGAAILIVIAGAKKAVAGPGRALFVYLGCALAVFLATAPKVGSDLNYQVESTILLALCAAASLHALEFYPLSFRGSKTWVTLLQLPLAVYIVLNLRLGAQQLLMRVAVEKQVEQEVAALRPLYEGGGRILTADYNAPARFRHGLEVEMLIYKLLVDAKRIDAEPVRRDIAAKRFDTILLGEDLTLPEQSRNAELATLPASQMQEIRRSYKLVRKIPEPYQDFLYVYKPKEAVQ
jgi:hypothetical protein